jgi:hypothetical protein
MTPEAQELVRATRVALRPSNADRERVLRRLLPFVGITQGVGLAHAATAVKLTLAKFSAVLVGVGVAGGGLYLASPSQPPMITGTATVSAKRASVSLPVPRLPAPPAPLVGEAPQAELRQKTVPVVRHSADDLADEVAILSRAGAELHAGQPAAALKTLEQHQRNYPRGVLTQERLAARVRALCALGRMTEAEVDLARLSRTSPNSPHEGRARKACGFVVRPED